MSIFEFIFCIIMISVPIGLAIFGAIVQRKPARAAEPDEELEESTVVAPADFDIDFYPDNETFDCSGPPVYDEDCTYDNFLRRAASAVKSDALRDCIHQLQAQENSMISLCNDIVDIVETMDPNLVPDVSHHQNLINRVYATYQQNREDAINCIADYADTKDKDERKKYLKIAEDIVYDNERIVAGVTGLHAILRKGYAFNAQDDTPTHVTDFTSLRELEQLVKNMQESLDDDLSENHGVPTIKVPRNMTTLLGTDVPLQEQSAETEYIIDPEVNTSPMNEGF